MYRSTRRWTPVWVAALAAVAQAAWAAPIQVGQVQIELPAPPDNIEVSEQLPTFRKIMEAVVPPSHRLVAIFASPADTKQMLLGSGGAARYLMVMVVRDLENIDIAASDFENVSALTKAQLPALDQVIKDAGDAAAKKASAAVAEQTMTKVDMKVGESKILGVYADEKDWIGLAIAMGMQVTAAGQEEKARTLICAANTVRVRNRLLYLFAYSQFDGDADKTWTQDISRAWIKATWQSNAQSNDAAAKPADPTP